MGRPLGSKNGTRKGTCFTCGIKLSLENTHPYNMARQLGRCNDCRAKVYAEPDKAKIRQALWHERKANGLCVVCGKEAMFGRTRCSWHALTHRVGGLKLAPEQRKLAYLAAEHFDGKCQCCGSTQPGGKTNEWHLDHDHKNKTFRGILCAGCNMGLGCMQDNPEILKKAAEYLISRLPARESKAISVNQK